MVESDALVEIHGLSKSFGATHALQDVDLTISPGEIHAIVGENGAGKSTLMRCLAGLSVATSGSARIGHSSTLPTSPKEAREARIAMVHQELNLFPHLSVAENVCLGTDIGAARGGRVKKRLQEEAAAEILDGLQASIAPAARLATLSIGERQVVEIARALAQEPRLLMLDEATSSLTEPDRQALFEILHTLRRRGLAIVYVSHRLGESLGLADTITVLRDGRKIITAPASEMTPERLVQLMVGRGVSEVFVKPSTTPGDVVLSLDRLSRAGEFRDVSLDLRAGEVLGLAGLIGAGRTEVAETVYGLRTPDSGEVHLDGTPFRARKPRDATARGVFLVPEDRRHAGIIPLRGVRENVSLPHLSEWARLGFVQRRREQGAVAEVISALRLRCRDSEQPIIELSGGNQQKAVVGRWLSAHPRVLILDEPTRGVDIGAKAEIHAAVRELVGTGVAVLLISSELVEIVDSCHRVAVFRDGEVMTVLSGDELTEETVMGYATGVLRRPSNATAATA